MVSLAVDAHLMHVSPRMTISAGKVHVGMFGECLLDALWVELLKELTGGRLRRCARPECGKTFTATDERQRFCPPAWYASGPHTYPGGYAIKSRCYEAYHQKELRRKRREKALAARHSDAPSE